MKRVPTLVNMFKKTPSYISKFNYLNDFTDMFEPYNQLTESKKYCTLFYTRIDFMV